MDAIAQNVGHYIERYLKESKSLELKSSKQTEDGYLLIFTLRRQVDSAKRPWTDFPLEFHFEAVFADQRVAGSHISSCNFFVISTLKYPESPC